MKNVLKRFGNLTQARSAKVPLVIIALVAVIGFSFAACGGDSGGGGDDPSPYLGDTVTISGEQVYMWNESEKLIKFEDNLTIKDTGGGKGAIANGKLTFTIGTPTDLKDISESFFKSNDWDDIKYEPSDAKWFYLDLQITDSNEYNVVGKENESGTLNNGWWEGVYYTYVDRDVTITGKGKTLPNYDPDHYEKTEDYNLSLKKGWNAVCEKESWKGTTDTTSLSLRNPKNAKWVVSDNGEFD